MIKTKEIKVILKFNENKLKTILNIKIITLRMHDLVLTPK